MSGSGRKSQYRKSVTDSFLTGSVIPSEGEEIVLVNANRGSNLFDIQLCHGEHELARLPSKFNKLIWIKKNDFVIVERNDEPSVANDTSKVKYTIRSVVNKDNIREMRKANIWPSQFEQKDNIFTRSDDLMPGYESQDGDDQYDNQQCEGQQAADDV